MVELRDGTRREPNTRATTVELFDGLVAASQNRWPSLAFDVMAVNGLLSPFFPAGFYYKTFMWPPGFWEKVYEPAIRRAAGLGRAAAGADPRRIRKGLRALRRSRHRIWSDRPDGGADGRRAPVRASFSPRTISSLVAVCWRSVYVLDEREAHAWVARIEAELAAMPEVRIMRRTSVFGVYDHGQYGAVERVSDHLAEPPPHQPRQRYWKIVARRAVLAAGASERPIAFAGNDRPGVMLAGAVRTYLNRFAATPASRLVVFTNNDDGWRTASRRAGCRRCGRGRSSIHAPMRSNVFQRRPEKARSASFSGRRSCGERDTGASRRRDHRREADGRVTIACDWPRRVRWLEPVAASHLPPRRQAAMARRTSPPSCRRQRLPA